MLGVDYAALKADIRTKGQNEPIWLYQGKILDGRHRYQACVELGIEPSFREYQGVDPVGFVVSQNLHRRHLDVSQRAMIAAEIADLKRGGERSKAQICALTHAQAAARFNVSPRTVDKASALLNAAAAGRVDPELLQRVRRGQLRLARAEKLAKFRRTSNPRWRRMVAARRRSDPLNAGRIGWNRLRSERNA